MTWLTAIPGALRLVPRWVWLALACAIAAHFVLAWHAGQVKAHDQSIVAARDAQWQARLDQMRRDADAWKAKAEGLQRTISEQQRKLNDEENRRIAAVDADLRLRGPGQAAAPAGCRPVNPAGVPAGAGRPEPRADAADAAGSGMSGEDGQTQWAVVPWRWVVGRSTESDLNRAEVLTWRSWYQQQWKAWEQLRQAPPTKGKSNG